MADDGYGIIALGRNLPEYGRPDQHLDRGAEQMRFPDADLATGRDDRTDCVHS
jgi:hypothetical protein